MLITIKNLQQQTFKIEIGGQETVLALKQRIMDERGKECDVEKQKLIYSGTLLDNQQTLDFYNIDEKKFLVVMVSKFPVRGSASADKPTPVIESDASSPPTPAKDGPAIPSEVKKVEVPQPMDETTSHVVNPPLAAEETLISGEEYNRITENMMEMGYTREQVRLALEASFNNPHRAAEYLLNGMPPTSLRPNSNGMPIRNPRVSNHRNRPVSSYRNASVSSRPNSRAPSNQRGALNPLGFLREQPQFRQMCQIVRRNPEFLHDMLNHIGQHNATLLQRISENQEAFLELLQENYSVPSASSSTNVVGSSTQGNAGSSTQGNAGSSTQGNAGSSTQGNAGSSTQGNAGSSTQGDAGSSTQSDAGSSTQGDDGSSTQGAAASSTQDDAGSSTQGDAGSSTQGDAGSSTQGDAGSSTQGDAGSSTQGDAGSSTQGDAGSSTQGDAGSSTQGDAGSSTQSDAGSSTQGDPKTGNVSGLQNEITSADQEAIERLEALGFERHLVMQSYFACDRNENMAANLLLSDTNED